MKQPRYRMPVSRFKPRKVGLGAMLAAGLLTTALAASTGAVTSSGAVRDGGTFRIAFPTGFTGITAIDPAKWGSATDQILGRVSCAALMAFPDKPLPAGWKLAPEVAAAAPRISNGRRTYTFTIRKAVRFSNGAPVTARSFSHAINRILNPTMESGSAGFFGDIVGAQDVIDGKAPTASGIVARRDTLVIRLTKPVGDFLERLTGVCAVPENLPVDPEGVGAPLPAAGPYFVARYVPGRQAVLERNRFYRGNRPHHVDRFVADLGGSAATILDRIESGEVDWGWVPNQVYGRENKSGELERKYRLNKSRFWVAPSANLRMFVLNVERPLFKDNLRLRQAVNFAIDRAAMVRERGLYTGFLTDQFLSPRMPGVRNEHIYPLKRPNVARARALARGNTRSGKAVLYICGDEVCPRQAAVLRSNLARIGIDVEVKQFPAPVLFSKLRTRGEPFDIGWVGWIATYPDAGILSCLFDGAMIRRADGCNFSYFDSPRYNRLLRSAARLTGRARARAYARLDVDIARNAAPAVPFAYDTTLTLVSNRVDPKCVIVNPDLDLAAVCLKR
jgi:peptide/nickel transport system substrate-binding protein